MSSCPSPPSLWPQRALQRTSIASILKAVSQSSTLLCNPAQLPPLTPPAAAIQSAAQAQPLLALAPQAKYLLCLLSKWMIGGTHRPRAWRISTAVLQRSSPQRPQQGARDGHSACLVRAVDTRQITMTRGCSLELWCQGLARREAGTAYLLERLLGFLAPCDKMNSKSLISGWISLINV